MKFWDSSAIVPLLAREGATRAMQALYRQDADILTWWGTEVDCASAIARLERSGDLTAGGVREALARLASLAERWHEIQPGPELRETAIRYLRVHPLRAADALQLGAAFIAAERRPATLEFACLDERLAEAAHREGFILTGPSRRSA